MKFGQRMAEEAVPEWAAQYVQYNALKALIKREGPLLARDRGAFDRAVVGQVARVRSFYALRCQAVERDLREAERTRHLAMRAGGQHGLDREKLLLRYLHLGEDLIRVFHFLELNATALRKILKKFRKHIASSDRDLLERAKQDPDSALALDLRELRNTTRLLPSIETVQDGIRALVRSLISDDRGRSPLAPPDAQEYSPIAAIRHEQYRLRASAILQDMLAMQARMNQSSAFLSFLSANSLIAFRPAFIRKQSTIHRESSEPAFVPLPAPPGAPVLPFEEAEDKASETLNLLSTFFYLCNYNLCLPTSGEYAAHLGLRASASGVIVAMTPLAALLSAVVYSWWSNFSFKKPMVCSSLLLVAGNVIYASAWDLELSSLILAGRFVSGLGGCRAVNRRYIADTISVQYRTRASAAFVAAGALGMACGPLLASFFAGVDTKIWHVTVNEMTAPAWFMAIVWIFFGAAVVLRFREPSTIAHPEAAAAIDPRHEEMEGREMLVDNGLYDDDDDDSDMESQSTDYVDIVTVDADTQGGDVDRERADSDELLLASNDEADGDFDDDVRAVNGANTRESGVSSETDALTSGRAGNGNGKMVPSYGAVPASTKKLANSFKRRAKRQAQRRRRIGLTLLCLWVIFWVKLVQEALLTEIPLAAPMYGWTTRRIGIFMAMLGLSVVPMNMLLVAATKHFGLSDSFWIRGLQLPLVIFSGLLISFKDEPVALWRYVGIDFALFVAAQVMEGVVMSYFSKIISKRLAAGTFNSGLLATEAGTLGRAVGNAVITLLGQGTAVELVRDLATFYASVSLSTLMLTVWLAV